MAAYETTVLGAKVAGRVESVLFDLGDAVSANERLVALDERDLELQLAQATAQLEEARAAIGLEPGRSDASLDPEASPPVREAKAVWEESVLRKERIRQLRDRDAASEEELQQAEVSVKVAESRHAAALNAARERIAQIAVRAADRDLAEQRLKDAKTLAPFDGFVRERHIAPGTYVQVGQPLFTLVRTDSLRFQGAVPERLAGRLRVGQHVLLWIEGHNEPRRCAIDRISPAVEESSRALLFEARVENRNQDVRAGLFAEAHVEIDPDATAIVVPNSAIAEFAGVEKVWIVREGVAREHVVRTGDRREERTEIVAGLREGDRIIAVASEGRAGPVHPRTSDGGPRIAGGSDGNAAAPPASGAPKRTSDAGS